MDDYIIPAGSGEAEYIDKKSRFIGRVVHAETAADAMAFADARRREYADATHNVWAYSLRDGSMRWSDDGEPGGTAGQPVLNVLRSAGVCDVCCVVTRYFGGILLGSGGLVRAYSKAASAALENAGRARMEEYLLISVACGYPQYERVRRLLEDFGAVGSEAAFGERVTVSASLPAGCAAELERSLRDATAGAAETRRGGSLYLPRRI